MNRTCPSCRWSPAVRHPSRRVRDRVSTGRAASSATDSSADLLSSAFGGLLLGRRVLLVRLVLLVFLVVSARVRSRLRGRLLRPVPLAPAAPVVGRVETGTAEMNRDRIENGLDRRCPADRTRLWRRIGNAFEDLEDVPVRTLVFVRGHEI